VRVLVVDPIVRSEISEHAHDEYVRLKPDGLTLGFEALREGPRFIETVEQERMAVPDLLRIVQEAERRGYDAVIINCFGDPGLEEARGMVDIPVIGAGESSYKRVKAMGRRFTVLTTVPQAVPRVRRNVRRCGVEELLASIRPLNLHVPELLDEGRLRGALLREGRRAILEDGAEVIVLGCTGMAGLADWLAGELGIPVIDPAQTALEEAIQQLKFKRH